MAKEWTITLTYTYSIEAGSEEKAEERAQAVADAMSFALTKGKQPKWWPDMDSPEMNVEEA